MAVAGLWLFDLYFATAFSGCVAFPVLDFWRDPSWQANVNLVPFRQIMQYLLCLVPRQGYLNGGGYAFRGHFAFWMNFFVFSVPVLLLPRISAPLARGRGRRLACRVGRQCDRGHAAVCAHRYRTIPV